MHAGVPSQSRVSATHLLPQPLPHAAVRPGAGTHGRSCPALAAYGRAHGRLSHLGALGRPVGRRAALPGRPLGPPTAGGAPPGGHAAAAPPRWSVARALTPPWLGRRRRLHGLGHGASAAAGLPGGAHGSLDVHLQQYGGQQSFVLLGPHPNAGLPNCADGQRADKHGCSHALPAATHLGAASQRVAQHPAARLRLRLGGRRGHHGRPGVLRRAALAPRALERMAGGRRAGLGGFGGLWKPQRTQRTAERGVSGKTEGGTTEATG